jgi:hypothetical protein
MSQRSGGCAQELAVLTPQELRHEVAAGVWTFETRRRAELRQEFHVCSNSGDGDDLRQEFHVPLITSVHLTPDGVSGHFTSLL